MKDAFYIYESVDDYQILQRDAKTNKAYVKIDGKVIEYETGGPYVILGHHDIYVGDIWVMAGQSNMRGHGFTIGPFHHTISPPPNVHLFGSQESWTMASDPTHHLVQSPRRVHHTLPDPTVKNPSVLNYRGASLGLSFASEYQQLEDGVPVGLVASAHGGTSLNDWKRPTHINSQTMDTTLYGAMMDRINKVGRVAGILWYQGESDTTEIESVTYYTRFQQWMDILRKDLGESIPFAFVQIGAHRVDQPSMVEGWTNVQDAQIKLFECHPNTAGVASLDGILDDRLHLSSSALNIVGKRLAMAVHDAKQGKASLSTPLPERARLEHSFIEPPSIVVEFKHMESMTWKNKVGSEIFGFEVICEDSKVTILSARVQEDRKTIRLSLSNDTRSPISISYGMNQKAINLLAINDMTLPAFKELKTETFSFMP